MFIDSESQTALITKTIYRNNRRNKTRNMSQNVPLSRVCKITSCMHERQHTATPNKKYKECSFLRVIVRGYVNNLIFGTIYIQYTYIVGKYKIYLYEL